MCSQLQLYRATVLHRALRKSCFILDTCININEPESNEIQNLVPIIGGFAR